MEIKNMGTTVCEDCPIKYSQVVQATGFRCGEFPQCWKFLLMVKG